MTTMKAMVYYGANDIHFEERRISTFCNLLMPLSNLAKSPFVVLTSGYRKVKPRN